MQARESASTPEIFVSEEGSLGLCTPTDRKPVVDSQKFATAGSGETIFDVITFSITVMIQFCDLLGLAISQAHLAGRSTDPQPRRDGAM